MKNTKRGFTLIELLVVVLIVGILAAVAVPQYQKAVNKSRLAEVWANLASIRQAASVHLLSKGEAAFNEWGEVALTPGGLDVNIVCEAISVGQCLVPCPLNKSQLCAYVIRGTVDDPQAIFKDENSSFYELSVNSQGKSCTDNDDGKKCAELGQVFD